jgi:hypothetical protein
MFLSSAGAKGFLHPVKTITEIIKYLIIPLIEPPF